MAKENKMKPSTLILKLLKKQKFVSIQMIRFHISLSSGKNVDPREIKKVIHDMRTKEGVHIGTSYDKGFFLIKTLKEHEKNQEFWTRRIKAAREMKGAGEKSWSRMNAKLLK